MTDDLNPQFEQMADESMVRGLRGQAEAIWPDESRLLDVYGLSGGFRIADIGCGTGEFARRLLQLYPQSTLVGVDLIAPHLDIARKRCAAHGDRATFRTGDAFALEFADDNFDLTVNRHMLQAVPQPERVVGELMRITRPGGRLHVLAEDYAMIHFHPVPGDSDRFWQNGPIAFGRATGTDLRIGRRMHTLLRQAGARAVSVDFVTVDTLRTPRRVFADIWRAWRDGYTDPIAERTELTRDEVAGYWEAMLACLDDPDGYAVWQIPVITGVKPS